MAWHTVGNDLRQAAELKKGYCPSSPTEVWRAVFTNTEEGQETPSRTRYRCREHRFSDPLAHAECKKCTPWFSTYEEVGSLAHKKYLTALEMQP